CGSSTTFDRTPSKSMSTSPMRRAWTRSCTGRIWSRSIAVSSTTCSVFIGTSSATRLDLRVCLASALYNGVVVCADLPRGLDQPKTRRRHAPRDTWWLILQHAGPLPRRLPWQVRSRHPQPHPRLSRRAGAVGFRPSLILCLLSDLYWYSGRVDSAA